jgi:phosphoribosylglycinamide formyltransferase-1
VGEGQGEGCIEGKILQIKKLNLAILGSTRGTHLPALHHAIQQQKILAKISIVLSNKLDSGILERARENFLPAEFIDPNNLSREQFDQEISKKLIAHEIDLIILLGYMRILSENFVKQWKNKIINVHPSLLPAFAGKMDKAVHQAVLESGIKETGCTVHFVTHELDAGPIILQKKCAVLPDDSIESLKARVQQLEADALIEVIFGHV